MYNDVKHSYSMTVCCIILANSVNIASMVTKNLAPPCSSSKVNLQSLKTNHVTPWWQKQKTTQTGEAAQFALNIPIRNVKVAFNDLLDVHKKCPTLSLSPSSFIAEHSCLFRPRKVHSTLSLCLHPACAHLTCHLYTLGTAILIRIRAFLEERLPSCQGKVASRCIK